jgi:predicted ATPase
MALLHVLGRYSLYGRNEQLAGINRLLEGMRSGRAGSLVLRGEAGIGKTALLDAAEEKAAGARVLRRCR